MTSPELGGNRPTTIRATVVLPEPDSPTSAKVSPLPDVEGDAVDGLEKFEMAAFEHAIEPRF